MCCTLGTAGVIVLAAADPSRGNERHPQTASPAAIAQPSIPHDDTLQSPRLRIPFDEFKHLRHSRDVLVVDVRDEESYRAGHIPGAVSMPLATLSQHVDRLRGERRPIFTYCG